MSLGMELIQHTALRIQTPFYPQIIQFTTACLIFSIFGIIFDYILSKTTHRRLVAITSRIAAVIYGIVSLFTSLQFHPTHQNLSDAISQSMLTLQIVLLTFKMRYTRKDSSKDTIARNYTLIIESIFCVIILIVQSLAIIFDFIFDKSSSAKSSYFFITHYCVIMFILMIVIIRGLRYIFGRLRGIKTANDGNRESHNHRWLCIFIIDNTLFCHILWLILMNRYQNNKLIQILSIQIQHLLHGMTYIIAVMMKLMMAQKTACSAKENKQTNEDKDEKSVSMSPLVSYRKARKYQNRFALTVDVGKRASNLCKIPENKQYDSPLTLESTFFSSTWYSTQPVEWVTSPKLTSPKSTKHRTPFNEHRP